MVLALNCCLINCYKTLWHKDQILFSHKSWIRTLDRVQQGHASGLAWHGSLGAIVHSPGVLHGKTPPFWSLWPQELYPLACPSLRSSHMDSWSKVTGLLAGQLKA